MALLTQSSVIQVEGQQYLFGLTWQPITREEADLSIARVLAEKDKAECLVLHKERESTCIGLCSILEPGLPSAASSAAREKKGSWAAVIKIAAGSYWLIAAHHGEVVPGTDIVFRSGQDALDEMALLTRVIPFEESYAAEGLMDAESEYPVLDISLVVRPGKGTNSINPSQSITDQIRDVFDRRKKTIAALAVVIIGGFYGTSAALDYYAKEEKIAAALMSATQKANDNQDEIDRLQSRKKTVEANWLNKPIASEFISACRSRINTLSLPVSGWIRERRWCADEIQVTFRKDWGSGKRIRQLASDRGARLINEGTVSKRMSVYTPAAGRAAINLLDSSVLDIVVSDTLEKLRLNSSVGRTREVPQGFFPDTKYYAIRININEIANISALATHLDKIPGLVVTSAEKSTQALWSIEMEIYHEKRKKS